MMRSVEVAIGILISFQSVCQLVESETVSLIDPLDISISSVLNISYNDTIEEAPGNSTNENITSPDEVLLDLESTTELSDNSTISPNRSLPQSTSAQSTTNWTNGYGAVTVEWPTLNVTVSPDSLVIEGNQTQYADHNLRTDIELIGGNTTGLNGSRNENVTVIAVKNGSVIVAQTVPTDDNVGNRTENTTNVLISLNDNTSSNFTSNGSNIRLSQATNLTHFSSNSTRFSNFSAVVDNDDASPRNLTSLFDEVTKHQFCKFPTPASTIIPRCLWKSTAGHQLAFWPNHIEVSLCIAFVEKLEQCQVMCEGQRDECQGLDFCPACVDYNCRLFKESPGGRLGLKLSNELPYVNFHQKVSCASSPL